MTIEKRLLKCLNHVGVIVDESDLASLEDFICDSITFITLVVELEQEFGIEIPDDFLNVERMATVSSIKEMVLEILKIKEKDDKCGSQEKRKGETNYEKRDKSGKQTSGKKRSTKATEKTSQVDAT